MRKKDAAIRRWLGQIYNCRGQLPDEAWTKFAAFYEELGYFDDVTPGRRLDGQDPWDQFQEHLANQAE